MTSIRGECVAQMVVSNATGQNIDPPLWETIKRWSALDDEIFTYQASFENLGREPKRLEIRDKMDGVAPSDGLFGTKWLTPLEQVVRILPQETIETSSYGFNFLGKYRGRNSTFGFHFEDSRLTEIAVYLNDSSEKQFRLMQAGLSSDFGELPAPVPVGTNLLFSAATIDGLSIEHSLFNCEPVGITERIQFRKI